MIWNVIFTVLAAVATVMASLYFVRMLQLQSYQGKMYLKWLRHTGMQSALNCFFGVLAAYFLRVSWVFFYFENTPWLEQVIYYGGDVLYLLAMVSFFISTRKTKEKLAFTGRVKRLIAALFILAALFHWGLFLPLYETNIPGMFMISFIRYLPGLILPLFVWLAYIVLLPVENLVKKRYFNDAKRKLAARDIIKIGITGSFGKTSTKFILGTMLSEKYNTLVTPSSYNTPMGVTRVIREQLTDAHEAFVAEMGARYKGDIKELCELVNPHYGLITSIGKQHMETFGSYEALLETKAELLDYAAVAFLNGDIEDCRKLRDRAKEAHLFGLQDDPAYYMRAADITVGRHGSAFTLIAADGGQAHCQTVLLGKHNIANITGAAVLAYHAGVPLESIAEGIRKVEPIEHRLQLIQGRVTVIDDAFNANPAGTAAAMEVLREFSDMRRVVVTPGMVELGEEQYTLNEEFGRTMAGVANVVIIVGKTNAEAIKNGLLQAAFSESCIINAGTLEEVTAILPEYAPEGSVVLFENDLPENYS